MKLLLGVCTFFMLLTFKEIAKKEERYCVYYSDQAQANAFSAFDMVVLDSDYHPYLQGFIQNKKTILGYISLGEVESQRSYFDEVKSEGILLQENKYWPGSFFVDVRDPKWTRRVIEDLIPDILTKRFDGLFLDTLDNPGELERRDPEKYAGMLAAAVQLVKEIRRNYPEIQIMMNRGYELLPEVGGEIDMEMGESVYADYNFEAKHYQLVEEGLYQEQVQILKNAQSLYPSLKIFTLDYWNPADTTGIKKIYQVQRQNGFIPYVATVELNTIVPEPK